MSDRPSNDRRSGHDRRGESLEARIAVLEEEIFRGIAKDVKGIREAVTDGLKSLDNRVVFLEDVRVRALEDWRLSQRVLETERERTSGRHFKRWEVLLGVAAVLTAGIMGLFGGLISAHIV